MNTSSAGYYFFIGLLLAIAIVAVLIYLPFLTSIVFAIALSVIVAPLYRFILRVFFSNKPKSTFAALITIFIVAVLVLIPGAFIVGKLYSEIQDIYYFLTEESGRSMVIDLFNTVSTRLSDMFFNLYPALSFDSLNVTEYLQQAVELGFSHLDTVFTGAGSILMGIFVTFFSLFYLLRDGRDLKSHIIALSPLVDSDDERIFHRLEQAVYSIVLGSLVVGVIQGILTGIGFAIFRVPDPTVWGSIAAVAALIPGVGTALILVPGIIYLFVTGSTGYAIGLLIWGMLAVGLIDNLLGPLLVNRGIKIHPAIILLSVLGGIALFGIVGFILGPLVIAFLFALLEIYKTSRKIL